jgi:hypothetical protein
MQAPAYLGETMRTIISALLFLSILPVAFAHHSTFGFYEADRVVEIEGTVTAVAWRNPHTLITVSVENGDRESEEWRIETGAISVLRTRGLAREFLEPGDRIKVAGDPSARGLRDIFGHNILLEDGREVLLTVFSEPRWTGGGSGRFLEAEYSESVTQAALGSAEGIFRVWSTVLGDSDSFPILGEGSGQDYPLTESARMARDAWNSQDRTQLGCPAKGMLLMMNTPLPIALVREGTNIVIRLEELDAERLIHMDEDQVDRPEELSLSGYSTGRWEGNTLVVETSNVDYDVFDGAGTSQSADISFVERFTLSDDEDRLDYAVTVTDPQTFTEPFGLSRYWIWRPEMELRPYECDDRTEYYDE